MNKMYKNCIKRVIDFTLSFFAILILSPLLIVLIILTAVAMKGNPFFVQRRPGKGGKIFSIIKFRTMSNKKDTYGNFLPDNERLNSFGKFLRKTSLDELPEFFNIFIGNMSLIGPRPLLTEYLDYYSETEKRRHDVLPGLTGWAQVNGRNTVKWDERFKLDVYYVDNLSFALDLKIFFLTIKKVIKRDSVECDTQVSEGNFAEIRRKEMENYGEHINS